eukprot:3232046-Pyramimonas_sp.AAC.1
MTRAAFTRSCARNPFARERRSESSRQPPRDSCNREHQDEATGDLAAPCSGQKNKKKAELCH